MTTFNYRKCFPLPTILQITAAELYQNPDLVRDFRMLGYKENVPYPKWIDHTYKLSWNAKRVVVDHKDRYSPSNLDIMLPPDHVIDSGGYDKFHAMIEDRFRTAFENPVPFNARPYFQSHTLEFFAVIATVLAAARPEVSETWTSRRPWAANDNMRLSQPANDNDPIV